MRRILILVIVLVAAPLAACAQSTKTITLPPDHAYAALKPGTGLGYEVAERACRSCHSTDYVIMQPRGDSKQWDAVVTKMIKVYGANLNPEEVKALVEYLSAAYGK